MSSPDCREATWPRRRQGRWSTPGSPRHEASGERTCQVAIDWWFPGRIADEGESPQDQNFLKGASMTPDWSQVTLEHVRRACEMYDAGAAQPKRPAQSTFLLLSGKTYPAKFIRGLAYRLATGVELDPNRDYSGGVESVRFFQSLGLAAQHEPSSDPPTPTATYTAPSPDTPQPIVAPQPL